jgi:hypothetical protein
MALAFFDTLGNLLHYTTYQDSLGDVFPIANPNSLIKCSDGSGYIVVGSFFFRGNGFWAKFDNHGQLLQIREYIDNVYVLNNFKQVIEVADGYMIGGNEYDNALATTNLFIVKTDKAGNFIWEKKFMNIEKLNFFNSLSQLGNNLYIMGSVTTTRPPNQQSAQTRFTSKIATVDSLGNLIWEWESLPSLIETGAGMIFNTPDGNWVYNSGEAKYNSEYNFFYGQPKLMVRDENFSLIKETKFGNLDLSSHYCRNMKQLSDGGWLLVGSKPVVYQAGSALPGWLAKVDAQANLMWTRSDTAFFIPSPGFSRNYFYDAVELPSGSIVVCGYNQSPNPVQDKQWGYLLKIDKEGCLDMLNCGVSATNEGASIVKSGIHCFPNPTIDILHIESATTEIWDRIEVYNTSGQLTKKLENIIIATSIDLSDLPIGIYWIKFTKDNQAFTQKVVKI